MKNLYLIIIAFVLGILIYTILPKFCGCDRVLEGHPPEHTGEENREVIYHILNSIVYSEDGEGEGGSNVYRIGHIPNTWEEIWSSECDAGGNKIYNQARRNIVGEESTCSGEDSYDVSGGVVASADHLERLIVSLIHHLQGEITSDIHNYNIPNGTESGNVDIDTQKLNLVKLAKVANILIGIHSEAHSSDPVNHISEVRTHIRENPGSLLTYYQGLVETLGPNHSIYDILRVDCQGSWTGWSPCNWHPEITTNDYQGGMCLKSRTYIINQEASPGGDRCSFVNNFEDQSGWGCPGMSRGAPSISQCPGHPSR